MSTVARTGPSLARLVAIFASLLVLAVVLAGCSSSAEEAPQAGADVEDGLDAGGEGGDVPGDGGESGNRSIIITGSMYMTVDKPLEAADEATSIVKSAGGRVDGRAETAADEWTGGSAELVLRIPTNRLDSVLADLRELGTVDQLSTTASDVTDKVTDLEARISTLRASTLRIEALLDQATSISDIIKLEDELSSRQAELESLEAQQRGLNDQVSLSTIELTLTTDSVVIADDSPSNFFDGLVSGWNGLTSFVSWALVILGVLLPWLLAAAVITIAVLALTRRRRSRQYKRAAVDEQESPHMESTTTS